MALTHEAIVELATKYLKLHQTQIMEWLSKHGGHDPRTCDACMKFVVDNASLGKGSED